MKRKRKIRVNGAVYAAKQLKNKFLFIFTLSFLSCSFLDINLLTASDYSADADGILWGTEGGVLINDANDLSAPVIAARDAINGILKTKYVKSRFQINSFTTSDGGLTYSPDGCLPSPSQCLTQFNLDETVKLYKDNGWNMVPMLSHNTAATVTTALIDRYVNFVDWFLGRYKLDANIRYLELINAPYDMWLGTPAQLLELQNKVYDRVKANHAGVLVGTPGFEYWWDFSSPDPSYVNGMAMVDYFLDPANGAKFDFWAFHGYALSNAASFAAVPPTRTPVFNAYAGVPGLLKIRQKLDLNGWQDRPIMDAEHIGVISNTPSVSAAQDALESAYMVQELVLKRTLKTSDGRLALSGALPLKIRPRGTAGEAAFSSLNTDGSLTNHVKAVGLLWSKLAAFNYSSHVSGAFDDEGAVWVEKFQSTATARELYVFFKPFEYVQGNAISLDGQTLNHVLSLKQVPAAATLTDVYGTISTAALAQIMTLTAENAPKYLEVTYDVSSPTAPSGLTAVTVSSTRINLSWSASTDDFGVVAYRIYRDSVQITTVTATSYGDSVLSPGITYTYVVAAYDAAGNMGLSQSTSAATAPDRVPNVNDGIGADIDYLSSLNTLSANWGGASGAISEYQYAIGTTPGGAEKLGWTSVGLNTAVTKTGLALDEGVAYYFAVKAKNSFGYFSVVSASDGQVPDLTAPSAPVISTATIPENTPYPQRNPRFEWSPSFDLVSGMSEYLCVVSSISPSFSFGDSQYSATVSTSCSFSGLQDRTTYWFFLRALDRVENHADMAAPYKFIVQMNSGVNVLLSKGQPLGSGPVAVTLELVDVYLPLAGAPDLSLTLSDGSLVTVTGLTQTGGTWTGYCFIETYFSTGPAVWSFTGRFVDAGTFTRIFSGSTLNIDTGADLSTASALFSDSDGTSVEAPPGAYDGQLYVSIAVPAAGSTDEADARPQLGGMAGTPVGISREITARNTAGAAVSSFPAALRVTIPYPDADNDGMVDGTEADETQIKMFYMDDRFKQWVAMPGSIVNPSQNTVSADTTHFTIFSIFLPFAGSKGIIVYPNPCDIKTGSLSIDRISVTASDVRIYVYNLAGELVRTLSEGNGVDQVTKKGNWDGRNGSGQKVASGTYIFLIKAANMEKALVRAVILW